jgi:hypothetical protein
MLYVVAAANIIFYLELFDFQIIVATLYEQLVILILDWYLYWYININ